MTHHHPAPDFATLPPRRLTEQERDGFNMACAAFATWGNQLAATSIRLAHRSEDPAGPAEQERFGRRMAWMAEALQLTIGRTG